jgi:hypothetical protein
MPTKDMIADGLTKSLPANKMTQFLKHVGLVDIRERLVIEEGKVEEIITKMERIEVRGPALSRVSSSERGSS